MTSEGTSGLRDPLLQQQPSSQITVSHIYKLRANELKVLFEEKNLKSSESKREGTESLRKLQTYGYVEGVLKKLATEADTGIIGDDRDIKRRKQFFGENTKPLPQIPPFKESVKEALDNRILLYLAIAAFFTIITGMIANGPKWGWIEGVSIYIAIFIIVTITSGNDWVKDKQFVNLASLVKDETIAVVRGKQGATQSVNIFDLVVGDVILLETGSRIPADCILIESQDLSIDESLYQTHDLKETRAVRKQAANDSNFYESPDPFLLSSTLVSTGIGKAVVCAVGANSRRGLKDEKLDTSSKTPLQVKLENMASVFTKWGIIASVLIFIANIINMSISIAADDTWAFADGKTLKKICEDLTLVIIIIIVAVPEGLPLTITLSLAYSVMRMKDDGILVKNLDSPEVMGSVEEICTGKTATLTKNDMKVSQFYSQSRLIKNSRKNTLFNCELSDDVIELIKESILFNCEARIEMNDKAMYVPVGNGTEVGLIRFLQEAEVPVHEIIKRKLGQIQAQIPFSTIRKRSIVALRLPETDIVRIYVKGAPEVVIGKCVKTFEVDGSKTHLTDEQQNYIYEDVIYQQFTSKALRTLAFAYKDMSIDEFNELSQQCNNFADEADREPLEQNLVFVGVFALQDDLRDKVLRSVQYAQKGNITVRMVSGDNLETARAVAIKAGIISEEESKQKYACMPAEEFRKLVGEVRKEADGEGNFKMIIQNKKEFQQIAVRLRVLARAVPKDKNLLVVGLKELGRAVAVTGDGINDVDALRNASVGFSMGSGCSVAKDSSDMILTDDNFEATMKAVMWGRNIYDNIRRFIQFQVTVNFSCLAVEFFGAAIMGEVPLSAVQLLWINLIMDTFAALALASEKPHPSIIRTPPTKEGELVMTKVIWRQIYGVALWNVIVMALLIVFGKYFWGLEFSKNDEFVYNNTTIPTPKCVMYTILFETFVFLQLFNFFNCRTIQPKKLWMFSNLLSNWLFGLIVLVTFAATVAMVQYGGIMTRTAPLTMTQHSACLLWGASTLVIATFLKLTPVHWVEKLPIFIDENKKPDLNDPLMAAYNKQAQAKAINQKSGVHAE